MRKSFAILLWAAFGAACLPGQIGLPRAIEAVGSASVSVNPDQVQLDAGVVTQAATAQDASQQNATQTANVIAALKSLLGANATIPTVSYYVSPRYSTTPGQSNVVVGYTVSNTVRATTSDLSLPGRLIDVAVQAGATTVGGISFSLKDPEPVVQQALGLAAKQARAHADAIAGGLGAKTGVLLDAKEGSSVVPSPVVGGTAAGSATTPITSGPVSVQATVTIDVQLIQ